MNKSTRFLFIIFLVLAIQKNNTCAQSTGRNILKSFTESEIKRSLPAPGTWKPFPLSPAEWQARYSPDILQKIIKEGEDVFKNDYPVITGSISLDYIRTGDSKARYEKLLFRKREMLWKLSLAESVEGKGRFTDKVLDGIWSVCEETFWGTTSVLQMQKAGRGLPDASDPIVELYAAETAALLSWVDYFNGAALDKITPHIRKRIRYEVNRRVFVPMLTAEYFYTTAKEPNNWAPWIMSNYINAQLLLEADENKRAKAIYYGVALTDRYINGLGEMGSVDEGVGYWNQAVGCVFDELILLKDASGGKLNALNNPYLQNMAAYIYRMHAGGANYINIGDAMPSHTPNALLLYRYGKSTGDTTMVNFSSWVYHTYFDTSKAPYLSTSSNSRARSLYNLSAINEIKTTPFTKPDVTDSWSSDIQVMSSRSNNGLFVAGYGLHNGKNHNHNDVGNILLFADDEPILIDVGPGNYTRKTFSELRYTLWFNTSPYHNLPTINDSGQLAGRQYTSSDVKYEKGKNKSSFSLDIAKTYPENIGVKKWARTIEMDKAAGVVTLTDNYLLTPPVKSITESFMTVCSTDVSTPGKIIFYYGDNKKVLMDYDVKSWGVKKEKMVLKNSEDRQFATIWKGKDIYRILLVNKLNKVSDKSVFQFYKAR